MIKIFHFINKHFKIFFFVFLLAAGFLNFWGSLKNPFFLDDSDHYANAKKQNPKFFSFDFLPSITNASGFENYENGWGYYRPLAHFTYSLESSFFHTDTVCYEIVSIFIFVIACYSIFLFLYSITSNRFLSAAASLLYLFHPFNGLCVNYKTAFVFSLQIIFLNLIFIYVSRILNNLVVFQWSQFALYLLLYFFTLLFHELVFVFPLILIVYCFWVKTSSFRRNLMCAGFLSVAVFYYLMRGVLVDSPSGGMLGIVFRYKLTWFEFCAAYARIIRWMITKLFYPHEVFLQWTTYIDKHMAGHWIWVFAFYIFLFLFFAYFFYKRSRLLVFFWLMFEFI